MRVSHVGGCQDHVKHSCVCISVRCLMIQPLVWWNCWDLTQAWLTWTLFLPFSLVMMAKEKPPITVVGDVGGRIAIIVVWVWGEQVGGGFLTASLLQLLYPWGLEGGWYRSGSVFLDTLFSSSAGDFSYFNFLLKTIRTSAVQTLKSPCSLDSKCQMSASNE